MVLKHIKYTTTTLNTYLSYGISMWEMLAETTTKAAWQNSNLQLSESNIELVFSITSIKASKVLTDLVAACLQSMNE